MLALVGSAQGGWGMGKSFTQNLAVGNHLRYLTHIIAGRLVSLSLQGESGQVYRNSG